MALHLEKKYLAAYLAKQNQDADYMIRLASDEQFAIAEITSKATQIREDLLKEKQSHEAHIVELNSRLSKITSLLAALEE